MPKRNLSALHYPNNPLFLPKALYLMRNQAFFLPILFLSASLYGQDTTQITIPGSVINFRLVYIPTGQMDVQGSDGQTVSIQLDAFWLAAREVAYDEFSLFQQRQYDSDASDWPAGEYRADAVSRPTPQYLDYTYGMGTSGGFPAVSMTQQAALRYCYWLYQKTGQFYRLPTEAEWAYACRAGQDWAPEELGAYAWYYDNAYDAYHKIGQKAPNPWGLYDMLGNVAEWTLDEYQKDYLAAIGMETSNPWVKPEKRHSRTVMGGSYDSLQKECSCTHRQRSQPRWQARDPQIPKSIWWNTDSPFVGFRIVRPEQQPSAEAVEAFFQEAIRD